MVTIKRNKPDDPILKNKLFKEISKLWYTEEEDAIIQEIFYSCVSDDVDEYDDEYLKNMYQKVVCDNIICNNNNTAYVFDTDVVKLYGCGQIKEVDFDIGEIEKDNERKMSLDLIFTNGYTINIKGTDFEFRIIRVVAKSSFKIYIAIDYTNEKHESKSVLIGKNIDDYKFDDEFFGEDEENEIRINEKEDYCNCGKHKCECHKNELNDMVNRENPDERFIFPSFDNFVSIKREVKKSILDYFLHDIQKDYVNKTVNLTLEDKINNVTLKKKIRITKIELYEKLNGKSDEEKLIIYAFDPKHKSEVKYKFDTNNVKISMTKGETIEIDSLSPNGSTCTCYSNEFSTKNPKCLNLRYTNMTISLN